MILIVDDHQDSAKALCTLLNGSGHSCKWVSGGAEALGAIRQHPADQPLLVILDDHMPQMSGIEVLQELRKDPKISHTPVVMLTAGFGTQRRDAAIGLGVIAWVLKGSYPSGVDGLIEQIGTWHARVSSAAQQRAPARQ